MAQIQKCLQFSVIILICTFLASTSSATSKQSDTSDWLLAEAESFDLHITPQLFRGQLKQFPQQFRCHTQGLEIIGDEIFISCCLYNPKQKLHRSYIAESFILKADLQQIIRSRSTGNPVHWTVKKMTEAVPEPERQRITGTLLNQFPTLVAKIFRWFLPSKEIPHVMGHPSGMIFDERRGGIWIANAVYSRDSYTRIFLISPKTLEAIADQMPISLPDHLGFVGVMHDHYLWSFNWSHNPAMFLIETESGRAKIMARPDSAMADYQDCDRYDQNTLLCSGIIKNQSLFTEQSGVLHLIKIDGTDFNTLRISHINTVPWQSAKNHPPTSTLGRRKFIYIDGLGDWETGAENNYGDYRTRRLLTNAGMAIGQNRNFIYFLPDDIPGGKLLRLKINSSAIAGGS